VSDTVFLKANIERGQYRGDEGKSKLKIISIAIVCIVSDFLYQHRVAFDGATSEVEVLDTCGCAVSCHHNY
jgi:hypothetical protein